MFVSYSFSGRPEAVLKAARDAPGLPESPGKEMNVAAPKYFIDVEHAGLGKFQRIQGTDSYVVRQRAAARRYAWDQQWERQRVAAEKREIAAQKRANAARNKQEQRAYIEARKEEADEATRAAESALQRIEGILEHTLKVDDRVDFDSLKDKSPFPEPPPRRVTAYAPPPRPDPIMWVRSVVQVSLWRMLLELFLPFLKVRRLAREAEYDRATQKRLETQNADKLARWQAEYDQGRRNHDARLKHREQLAADWASRKHAYEARQITEHARVDQLKKRYLNREADAVEQYCDLVLSRSEYPEGFPQTFLLQYRPEAQLLVLEYTLPSPAHLPSIKTVKYVQGRDEMVESHLGDGAQRKLYEGAIYQIVLRTLHELFEADTVNAIAAIAFNGVVDTIDPATGKKERPCIVSLQATKSEFVSLNLAAVEPKACFKKLRGVGSAQLHVLVAVPPLVRFAKEDVRFVDGRAVLDDVEEGQNIACMDWNDFEHLIRDLFEREFASGEADVRVTRASRDGGVDAVIFDPDPIRGGKLVVQAKRYTNTVGVAAVRDLYGAMTAERASKGILVTTATFGADSWDFAKDKPITLLDGGGLLHLLHKHGVAARIDLQEARRVTSN
ncbi:MAG TPA: restriction endonuclease [Polyangiaceae bacterium]|nr:restriction endonuclease [Polyangiaceae bacterium]